MDSVIQFLQENGTAIVGVVGGAVIMIVAIAIMDSHSSKKPKKDGTSKDAPPGEP